MSLISEELMSRVNGFTCHSHVYPRMEWTIAPLLPSHRASPHWLLLTFHPAQGRRL